MKPGYIGITTRGMYGLWLVSAIVATGFLTPLGYMAAAIAAVVFIIALATDARYIFARPGITVTRTIDHRMHQGEKERLRYDLHNDTATAYRFMLCEYSTDIIPLDDQYVWLTVAPHSALSVARVYIPKQRGLVKFSDIALRLVPNFGLLERRYRGAAVDEAQVFPSFAGFRSHGALGEMRMRTSPGLRNVRRPGQGGERMGLRDYVEGDAFRSIDFKASARRGALVVAEKDIERSQQLIVMIDCGRLMTARIGERSLLDCAVAAGLAIAEIAGSYGDRLGLYAFAAETLSALPPRAGAAHAVAFSRTLAYLVPRDEESDYTAAARIVRQNVRRRGVVIVFTHLFDPSSIDRLQTALVDLARAQSVLCVVLDDGRLAAFQDQSITTTRAAMQTAVATEMLREKKRAVALLRAGGVRVVEALATNAMPSILQAYQTLRHEGSA